MEYHFTILGSNGFIGQALTKSLKQKGYKVNTPKRNLLKRELRGNLIGHVIYCIGLTADFRTKPLETVDAHVVILRNILEEKVFESLTYLSSTRIYMNSKEGIENIPVIVQPENKDYLYNLSKLLGESLCHEANCKTRPIRVVRLSNVIGNDINSDNFVYAILKEALTEGKITINSSLDTAKDYISINDVVELLEKIAINGRQNTYNIASGKQIKHSKIIQKIKEQTGAKYKIESNNNYLKFPKININRIKEEFNYRPSNPLKLLDEIIKKELHIKKE